jgi:hypothetical protein
MRHAAIWLTALVLGAGSCDTERECKSGTLLVVASFPAGVDELSVSVSINGGTNTTGVLANPSGGTSGSVEVEFNTYPAGAMVTVRLDGRMAGAIVASKTATVALEPNCTRMTLTLDPASCPIGSHPCADNVCVDDTSVDSCGTSCVPCPIPNHGTSTCTTGSCGALCDKGFSAVGATCDVSAPRPIFPSSGTYTSGRQPKFEWVLAPDTDGAHIDICTDRACAAVIHSADVTGTSYTPPTALIATGTLFWRLAGRVGTVTGTLMSPVWEFQPLKRSATVKTAFGRLTDINNDGYADVVIGDDSALAAGTKGSIYVHYGASSGAATTAATILTSGDPGGRFGTQLALLGDVDGDGFSDLLVGQFQTGKAFFLKGSATGLVPSSSTTLMAAASGGNADFGYRVAAAGDLNGDGYADAIVGGYYNAGQGAWVFYGGPNGLPATPSVTLTIPNGATWFGYGIGGAGDVNRDGYADMLVGDPGTDKVYLYLGSATGIHDPPSQTLSSPLSLAGRFGEALRTAGDVNGDGYADVVISANSKNQAWIFNGIPTGINATATASVTGMSNFGFSVDCAGDVNGDGYSDVVITELNSAAQHLYLGTAGGLNPNQIALTTSTVAGASAAGAGDINGDGVSDFVIGVPGGTAGNFDVFYGSTGTISTSPTVLSDTGVTGRYGVAVQ